MAEMTLRLRINPETGKKDVIISLRSDPDALPHEHEQMHRELVAKLLERGALSDEELGDLVVERREEERLPDASAQQQPQAEREAHPQGE